MSSRLRTLRRVAQLVFLAAFLLLFAVTGYPVSSPIPVDLFLRTDPLIALSAMLSLRRLLLPLLWYALPVTLLSLLLGRVFCGWVCPMGTAIDLSERLFRIRGRPPSQAPRWRRVKFYLLIALLVTMALPAAHRSAHELALSQSVGLSTVYAMDPIAILTRTLTLAGVPAVQWAVGFGRDVTTAWGYSALADNHPWIARALNPIDLALNLVARPDGAYFRLGLLSFLIFAGVVALGRFARRFWCRNLCPLGALLGVLGKASPVRLRVSDKCTRCMRCVNECKVGAISDDPHRYCGPECISCYSCIAVCPERAISLTIGRGQANRRDKLSLERRRVLEAMGAGIVGLVLLKVDWATRRSQSGQKALKISSERLIRPPGSLPENSFVTACVRCGECMKVCPSNTLQPALGEGGLEAVATPILVPRMGPCLDQCNACSQVCPTSAIQPFAVEEKSHLYLGTADVDRSKCIAWAYGRQCLVCDGACPYNAIYPDLLNGLGRPLVDDRICVGCGQCEWVCPVEPRGAIHVSSSGDRRHLTREEQCALRQGAESKQDGESKSPYPGL